MSILVEQLMISKVVTTHFGATLSEIQRIFEDNSFHHILVLDASQKLAGIISDRDILKNISPFIGTHLEQRADKETLLKTARQIMTPNPVTIYQDQTIPEAARVLTEKGVTTLPVLNRNQDLVGILSWKDVLKLVAKAK